MLQAADVERLMESLPLLRQAGPERLRALRDRAFVARIPANRDVFVEGDRVDAIPLLVRGTVRVYQTSETGREVTLYRFGPGESCVLTANSILTRQAFPAVATVEEEAEAVMVPADAFRAWVQSDDLWRAFFFELVAQRLARVMAVVDEVAFQRLDRRVAALLARRAREANPIRVTHQQIADELGSAREVISRIVDDLRGRGWIAVRRGTIEVTDLPSLEELATA